MKAVKQFLFAAWGTDAALLVLRLLSGAVMLTHGIAKLQNFTELSSGFMDPIGLGPAASLTLIVFAEVGCASLLVLGLLTRLAAIPLIIGMSVAAFVAHAPFTVAGSELPLLYLIIFVVLLLAGAGRYSLDACLNGGCCCCCKKKEE